MAALIFGLQSTILSLVLLELGEGAFSPPPISLSVSLSLSLSVCVCVYHQSRYMCVCIPSFAAFVCMCVCICVYACVYICIYVCVYICVWMYVYIYMYGCDSVYGCLYTVVKFHTHLNYVRTHKTGYPYTYTCICRVNVIKSPHRSIRLSVGILRHFPYMSPYAHQAPIHKKTQALTGLTSDSAAT